MHFRNTTEITEPSKLKYYFTSTKPQLLWGHFFCCTLKLQFHIFSKSFNINFWFRCIKHIKSHLWRFTHHALLRCLSCLNSLNCPNRNPCIFKCLLLQCCSDLRTKSKITSILCSRINQPVTQIRKNKVEHLSSPSLDLSFTGQGKGKCKIYMSLSKCRMETHMQMEV